MDERAGLSGLDFLRPVGGTAKAPIHRYKFPPQETELRGGEDLRNLGGDNLGKVDAISFEERTLDIKKRKDSIATVTGFLHFSSLVATLQLHVHLICRFDGGIDYIADDLMTVCRDANCLATAHEFTNHTRPREGLACAWGTLYGKNSVNEISA